MRRKTVRIDTIPAGGVELADEQLARMLGGLPRRDVGGSSKTIDDIPSGGRNDTDSDF
ncbi:MULTISPECIES: putative ATP-grasp target RiPP [Micromonospora]|uniref:ATP-grasp target RiPP n=2 Tax=Micromonospora TaxID=1873 RepID=A0ABS2ISV9_9ACTN|nr:MULTISPECIES: putative ATP-grasp target RiPP [Micromonospora]MBM7077421.1 putative ATP-grasp target RiPP [Micromonospora humida]MBO4159280.1 putative ATP-grasp target RiPP [Micromonospora antibiotica]